jgi:hypothetical protein
MASVNQPRWESTLPLTRSLSDSGIYFYPLGAPASRRIRGNKATDSQSPVLNICQRRVLFQRTATRQQWIVQRLYNDAVNETVELRLLTVFQHVIDPTGVCRVADKNAAVPQLNLGSTAAD